MAWVWAGGAIGLWLVAGVVAFLWRYGAVARRAWREPVLRLPVLVVESDDWGPAGAEDAGALRRLMELLRRHRDSRGNPAVMTIGVILGVPDSESIVASHYRSYACLSLDQDRFSEVRNAMSDGEKQGVFSLQLHGLEHYWPPALMARAVKEEGIRRWLSESEVPRTERLPAELQSRWVDAQTLPSRTLPPDMIREAVVGETEAFRRTFGRAPTVVVPPTFVWTEPAEDQWKEQGVTVLVTPGLRYSGRDAAGRPTASGRPCYNGEAAGDGLTYVVRDEYFEPTRGHRPEGAIQALLRKTRAGRPTLLETHRFNFVSDLAQDRAQEAFERLDELLGGVVAQCPSVRFMPTVDLARALRSGDPDLVEDRWLRRLSVWIERLRQVPGLPKAAAYSGVLVVAWLVQGVIRLADTGKTMAVTRGC